MKKIILLISILLLIPVIAYSGFGKSTKIQPDLENVCKNWKKGDTIPDYLLEDESEYNSMWGYSPCFYIESIDNLELLWSLLYNPEIPDTNFYCTTYRLLNIIGINNFEINLKERLTLSPSSKLSELRNNFKGRCLKVYQIFIRKDIMSYKEAAQVLEKIKKDIVEYDYENVRKIYHKWQLKYEYTNEEGHKRTKIGNGGHFYFSAYTKRIFSFLSRGGRILNMETISELYRAREGDLIIIQEYAEGYDKELRARYNNVATDTEDQISLYIILEET